MEEMEPKDDFTKIMLAGFHVFFLFFLVVSLTTQTDSKFLDMATWFLVYTTGFPVVLIDLFILAKKFGKVLKKKENKKFE